MSVLMIAEKPSLAQALAQILSNGNMTTRKSNMPTPVHEYSGSFLHHKHIQFKFTSVCGHLFATDFEPKYKSWDSTEPMELYSAKIVRVEANPKLHLVSFLRRESKGCRYLVLWLDCDKEGENICFEIIDTLDEVMHLSLQQPNQNIFRAHFSAITAKDIKEAFRNLRLPNKLEALSVTARQELDLVIGCSFTRYQTRFFHGKYGDLDSSLISYGPCQIPTLAFCVDRHDAIISFKPVPYWTLSTVVAPASLSKQYLNLEWTGQPMFDQGKMKALHNSLKNEKKARVVSITRGTKKVGKPGALNTVEMLKVASAKLGLGPHQAMQIAERLYTQGYISYPRTETSSYPTNFNLNEPLEILRHSETIGSLVGELLRTGISAPKSGHDAGDHPPITPMKCANFDDLAGDAWRVYDYITRHFAASLAPDMVSETITIVVDINGQQFKTTCSNVIEPGFTKFLPKGPSFGEQTIPSCLKEGDTMLVSEVKINNHMTKAPDYLTESELISLMEKHGIGTDASIPTHINNICLRNYVTIEAGRTLVPTKLGIMLVHGYRRIDNDLVASTIRSDLERELTLIAKGQAQFEQVLEKNIDLFKRKFHYFMENINKMDELFEKSFTSLVETGKPFSRCGKCKRFMKLITTKPERIVCPTCNETYNIPSGGAIKTYKEVQCPLDGFDLLYYSSATRNFIFCPQCYNEPPFEEMGKGAACIKCLEPSCQYSQASNTVCTCLVCKQGLVVLDQGSGPSSWRIACSQCPFTMTFFHDCTKVSVEELTCQQCHNHLVKVKYAASKTRLANGLTEFRGCLWCSAELASMGEALFHYSNNFSNKQNDGDRGRHGFQRGGGHPGRGGFRAQRGGGPRGRGRGRGAPRRGRPF